MLLAFIISIVTLLLVTAALVYGRNPKNNINRNFGIFTFVVGIWVLANFVGANYKNYDFSVYFITADLLIGPFVALSFWQFARSLAGSAWRDKLKVFRLLLVFGALIAAAMVLTGGVASLKNDNSEIVISYGNLYDMYSFILGFTLLAALYELVKIRINANRDLARQLNFMFIGVAVAVVAVSFSNLILPLLTDDARQNLMAGNLSYLGIVVFVMLTGYSIVKHRLFDVRLIVARSIAYISALGLLVLGYAIITSLLVNEVFGFADEKWTVLVNAVVFAVAVLIYQPLKKFFDRFTNKYFYRDAYDPQEFLDELNKCLVDNIELGILLRQTSSVIEKYLKCAFCLIGVRETDSTETPSAPLRMVGTRAVNFEKEEIAFVRDRLFKLGRKTVVTDDIDRSEPKLYRILNRYGVSVVVRLKGSTNPDDEALAYLLLGPKKSGNIYGKQDYRVIDIIADELVIAIQNALRFEEIQGFAATLQSEVNQATSKLKSSNKKLRDLDETKDEFISMASHQLRTPLTSVKGYMSMVLEGDAGKISNQQRELLNQAFVSSQRMVYLIADLLNVSRLKTGKFVVEEQPVNLADVVEGEISQLTEVAKGKKISLSYKKPERFPLLMLDETKIRQVIMNFADNAIYYTPSGGKVEVDVRQDRNNVYFTVKDNGLGVPKDEQKHLFSKFYRASNAKKARPDGTGLGLFMAKKVVNAQGGNILFKSVEGQGSMFGFTFNKAKLKPPVKQAEIATPVS